MLFIFAIILTTIADMVWGGQFDQFIPKGTRRIIAVTAVFAAFYFAFGLAPSATIMSGYIATRILGWRFILNGEAFLGMQKPIYIGYAFIHGLAIAVIPVILSYGYEMSVSDGLVYWASVSAILAVMSFATAKLSSFDFVPLKEALWGAIFGFASWNYLANTLPL